MKLLFNSPFCQLTEAPKSEIRYFADKKKIVDDAVLDYAFAHISLDVENTAYTREKYQEAQTALRELESTDIPCELEVGILPEEYIQNNLAYKNEAMLLEISPEDSKKLHFYDKYVAEVLFDLKQFCPFDNGIARYVFTINPKALELFAQDVYNLCSSDQYSSYYNTHIINPEADEPTLLIPLLWTYVYRNHPDSSAVIDSAIRYTLMKLTPGKTFISFPSRVMV